MRIDIIGPSGSGKSTMAARLAKGLNMPHIQIDKFWFEAGGKQGSHDTKNIDEVRAHIRKSLSNALGPESWVSDGTYIREQDGIAPLADVIIFLDIPLHVRLWNHTRRIFFESRCHQHLSIWDEVKFYKEIVKRTYTTRPKIISFIRDYKDKTITLRSYRDIDLYVSQLLDSNDSARLQKKQ